jgi:ATP-dependent DNA helicase RecG
MDLHELEALLTDIESQRVERKSSASDMEKIQQAVCAFANDLPNTGQPGVLFVGVDDRGHPTGLPITDELLLELSQIRDRGNILPLPSMTVEKIGWKGKDVAAIVVEPSSAPPVRYRGRVYIRVGPRRAIASADDERRLAEKRRYKDPSFDLWPVSEAKMADLDLNFVRDTYFPAAIDPETLEANERSIEDRLRSLRLLRVDSTQPTVAGMLIAGKQPRFFLPGAYVQFLRIAGETLADPIRDEKAVDGHIFEISRQMDEIFRNHVETSVSVTEADLEVRRVDYPIAALQQLFRNALMHRNYEGTNAPVRIYWFDDRIEIHSPGGPYGHVTPENFGTGVTDYRNPVLSESMKSLGLVQRFGVGIATARQYLRKNESPDPLFHVTESAVVATARKPS